MYIWGLHQTSIMKGGGGRFSQSHCAYSKQELPWTSKQLRERRFYLQLIIALQKPVSVSFKVEKFTHASEKIFSSKYFESGIKRHVLKH